MFTGQRTMIKNIKGKWTKSRIEKNRAKVDQKKVLHYKEQRKLGQKYEEDERKMT